MMHFNNFIQSLNKDTPVKIAYKDESKFMKLLGALLFFNKGFMDMYITTIGNTVYYPSRKFIQDHPIESILVMAHEFVHIKDSQKFKFAYPIMYLFPQVFALLSLLSVFAFFTPYAWLFLVFIAFALPIPSPGRKYIELRGYKMSLFALDLRLRRLGNDSKYRRKLLENNVDLMNKYFTGPDYYFMWPSGVKEELLAFVDDIESDRVSGGVYDTVKDAYINSEA